MREVILDTETTGLSPSDGHKVVEIGLVELIDRKPTGRYLHHYINPGRKSDPEAFKVHGLSTRFLKGFPRFAEVSGHILEFIAGDTLVIHNAMFDMGFMAHELGYRPANPIVDSYELATKMFPGGRHSLDAMVSRLGVEVTDRSMHGALLDASILSSVYVKMMQPRDLQQGLFSRTEETSMAKAVAAARLLAFPRRTYSPSQEEISAHAAMLEGIKSPLWTNEQEVVKAMTP